MKTNKNNNAMIESLEARALFSATPAVVGYLPDYNYAALQTAGSTTTLNKVNWAALTQVNYFSVIPDGETGYLPGGDPTNPTTQDAGNSCSDYSLSQLTNVVTEAHKHNVKVSIVVGGAGQDDSLTAIIANPDLQLAFAQSVQAFANKFHVDGVDLDWELSHPTVDQINGYGDLIHVVRTNTTGLRLSAAVYAQQLSIATEGDPKGENWNTFAYDLNSQAMTDLDQVGVMDYDLDYANHAPLAESKSEMDDWAKNLQDNGVSASKLLFGVPFYGKAGTSWDNNDEQTYSTLIDTYNANHSTAISIDQNDITASFKKKLGGKSMKWYFNGVTEVQQKTQYAIDKGFGGVMAWDLGQDHLAGTTNGQDDKYSLLAAIGRTVAANAPTTPVTPTAPTSPATTGTISGTVFNDNNSNYGQDTGELGLAGWTVFIDTNHNGVRDAGDIVTTTDAQGRFNFSNLAVGNYDVCVQAQIGYSSTNWFDQLAVVTAGNTAYVGFGEVAH